MSQNAILAKNEYEGNRLSAKIMLVSIGVLFLVYLLEYFRIFTDDINTISIVFLITGFVILIPPIVVFIFKQNSWWVKYLMVSTACILVAFINTYMSKDVIVLYLYGVTIASLYFSRRLSWYSVILSMIALTTSQIISTNYGIITDLNYMTNWFIPVLSRNIELLLLALIYIILAKRTRKMLENIMGADEQQKVLNRLLNVMKKSSDVSNTLSSSVTQLSKITNDTTETNKQISSNTEQIAAGSESTLNYIGETSTTVTSISKNLDRIAAESKIVADISKQVSMATENSANIIGNAISEMMVIEKKTRESKEIINRLGRRSNEIEKIVEIITDISGQTNLLALNAAIESARAGEQGRGFAVVSEEIRKLAEQSEKSAKSISGLIKEILNDTKNAVDIMDINSQYVVKGLQVIEESGKSIEMTARSSKEMNVKIQDVNNITQDVAADGNKIAEIVQNINNINLKSLDDLHGISSATRHQLLSMEQIASSVQDIDKISKELQEVVNEK